MLFFLSDQKSSYQHENAQAPRNNNTQYLEGMICILPILEKKNWKMFPQGTEGKTKSHHFVLVFV